MKKIPILRQILTESEDSARKGQKTLAVFDLDSTLFDVSPRLQRILDELALEPFLEELNPELSRRLKGLKIEKSDWGIRTALQRIGLHQSHPHLAERARGYWAEKFFTNDYLWHDVPYPGATEFVTRLHQLGTEIIYLTGRDQHRMKTGSIETLQHAGFPLTEKSRAELVLKPHQSLIDHVFKTEWFSSFNHDDYAHIWFFENEPHNIEPVRHHHPKVQIIFFDSTHSGRRPSPLDLPTIQDYLKTEAEEC